MLELEGAPGSQRMRCAAENGPEVGVPGAPRSATSTSLTGIPALVVALCVVLAVQAAFVLSYVGALHGTLKNRRSPTGTVTEREASAAAAAVV